MTLPSSRLARPALAASVGHWKSDWEVARRKEIAETVRRKERERFEGKGFKSAKATEEAVLSVRAEMTQKLALAKQAAADQLQKELEKQRVVLTGSHEEFTHGWIGGVGVEHVSDRLQ